MGGPIDRRSTLFALTSGAIAAHGGAGAAQGDGSGLRGDVDPIHFGARYDGVSDDSAALQRAVDACAEGGGQWRNLVISGPLLIARSVMIDRPVDRSLGIFQIAGVGNGRLLGKGRAPLFDSRLPMQKDPVSEYVRICDLAVSGGACPLFSEKFIRIQIENCFFDESVVLISRHYIQSLEISSSRFIGKSNYYIIHSNDAYNINIDNCNFERSGKLLKIDNSASGISIDRNVFETCDAPIIDINGVNGLNFNGNYTEYNEGPAILLGNDLGKSRGISIFGNNLKGTHGEGGRQCEIVLGRAEGVASGGNYCSGNLYDTSYLRLGGMRSMGDIAQGRLTSTDIPVDVMPAGVEPAPVILDLSGKDAGDVQLISAPVTIVKGTHRDFRHVQLPVSVSDGYMRKVTLINEALGSVVVKLPGNAGFLMRGAESPGVISPGAVGSFLEYEKGRWCRL